MYWVNAMIKTSQSATSRRVKGGEGGVAEGRGSGLSEGGGWP